MRKLVQLIYWILLPVLNTYTFIFVSAQQLGAEDAQRTMQSRIFLVIFVTFFLWGTGYALLGAWEGAARHWENLGVLGYQQQSLFMRICFVLAALAMLVVIAFMVSDAVNEYLPHWVVYRPLIVGFALIVEAIGLTKYTLDILNTGHRS